MTPDFYSRPFAHRGLHGQGRAENSMAAFDAAIAAGYGIELDLQLSKDAFAMVFHDYSLERLTGETGAVAQRDADALGAIPLIGGGGGIPTLGELLVRVSGQVPLLVEFKDQDGAMGPDVGVLESAAAEVLRPYQGPVAVMSFNPHSVECLATLCPDIPRGLTTSGYRADDWPTIPSKTRERLAGIPDFEHSKSSFISHDRTDLTNPAVTALKARDVPIFCWTVRSSDQEAQARQVANQITFEGYTPDTGH